MTSSHGSFGGAFDEDDVASDKDKAARSDTDAVEEIA